MAEKKPKVSQAFADFANGPPKWKDAPYDPFGRKERKIKIPKKSVAKVVKEVSKSSESTDADIALDAYAEGVSLSDALKAIGRRASWLHKYMRGKYPKAHELRERYLAIKEQRNQRSLKDLDVRIEQAVNKMENEDMTSYEASRSMGQGKTWLLGTMTKLKHRNWELYMRYRKAAKQSQRRLGKRRRKLLAKE